MAILFSDVRQFSNFAETRDPEAVIELLNQVLSIQAEIVKKHGGDIDKFVGDALIAWFSGEDRCYRAVSAANQMIDAFCNFVFEERQAPRLESAFMRAKWWSAPSAAASRPKSCRSWTGYSTRCRRSVPWAPKWECHKLRALRRP